MFWSVVASSTVASTSSERTTAPYYQQKHIKPIRPISNNCHLSNAAFKAMQEKQKQQWRQEQKQQEKREHEQLQIQKQHKNSNNRVTPKRESKIFKVFTSCKCAQG